MCSMFQRHVKHSFLHYELYSNRNLYDSINRRGFPNGMNSFNLTFTCMENGLS